MKTLLSFTKKEFTEHIRSGRFFIITGVFILLGILCPVLAKFTPELIAMMTESQVGSGTQITVTSVSVLDSWVQFFKNLPIALIVFVLLESNIFTKEYQRSTLVLALTKGLKRYKVIVAKTLSMLTLWSFGYWLSFGITFGTNTLWWDNSEAANLGFACFNGWLLGVFAIALAVLFSTFAKSNIVVLAGTGGVIFGSYIISLLPKVTDYMPTLLMDGNSLIYGIKEPADYTTAIIVTACLTVFALILSVPVFNKKQI